DTHFVKKAATDLVNKKIDHKKTTPQEYVDAQKAKSASLISDESILTPIIEKLITDNPTVVAQYKSGKTGVLGFFVGGVMKATAGKADPKVTQAILLQLLS